ncbi:transmembrane protein [Anaeramoeba flamelloides]|uniref:Transmembrane protein n=1 Tax=Anaeramoeba flamelloides TaxID=1746091 RepID=A0ABQ8X7X3_9EUKA|nr:transmembrane protein [Anaeramoeba flamelloides]
MKTKIDWWTKKHFLFFYITFFIALLIGLLIGGFGPDHLKQKEFNQIIPESEETTDVLVRILDVDRLNQFLFVNTHFANNNNFGFTQNVEYKSWLWGTNDLANSSRVPNFYEETTVGLSSQNGDGDGDDDIDGWDLLEYSKHKREVECEISKNCTKHTMLFVPYLHHKNYFLRVKFNNTYEKKYSKIFIDKKSERKFLKFYLPKIVPLIGIWITFFVIFIYSRIHEYDDPQFETIHDIPGYLAAKVLFWIFIAVYILNLIYSSIRSLIEIKKNPQDQTKFYFFFSLFLISFVMIFIAFVGNYISTLQNTSLEFLSYFTIFNIYIIFLSYAYLPKFEKVREYQNEKSYSDEEDGDSNSDSDIKLDDMSSGISFNEFI